jgi:hypothetical protein
VAKGYLAAIDDQSSNTDPFETSVENAGVRFIPQPLGFVQSDAIHVSPRPLTMRRSDMSGVGGKPEVPEARPK